MFERCYLFFIFFLVAALSNPYPASAKILELIPTYEAPTFSGSVGWRSDLWTSPQNAKPDPVRLYEGELTIPFLKNDTQGFFFKVQTEGLSSGRADLVVERGRVLVGSDLRSQAFGLGYSKIFADSSWYVLKAFYSSDSDAPYESQSHSTWAELTGVYAFPGSSEWQMVVLLNFSQNRLSEWTSPTPYWRFLST